MLLRFEAPSTTVTSSAILSRTYPVTYSHIPFTTYQLSISHRNINYCFQRLLSYSSRLNCYRYKAMAEAVETMASSTSSPSGSKQALISLSDKKDLNLLATGLQELGYTIVSTGGTTSALEKAGISVTKVEELTKFPEMLDGRVKFLHPSVHGGILARRDQSHHMEALEKHSIVTSTNGITFDDGIENIYIGGPTMIRAATKNHKDVLVVVDTQDYPLILEFLKRNKDDQQFRRKLAWKAFQHVAAYDSAVSEWLWKQTEGEFF